MKIDKTKKTTLLIGLSLIFILIIGGVGWKLIESNKKLPAEFNDGFGQTLHTVYENQSGTFRVRFPTQPNVIDVGFMGFPVINYYAVDTKTGDEYKVSHLKDVQSIVGIDAKTLVANASQVLLGILANGEGKAPGQGQFKLLKNEPWGDEGQIVEAEVYDQVNGNFDLYRLVARGNAMMVISAGGNRDREKTYRKFIESFEWLKIENEDQSTIKLDNTNSQVMSTNSSKTATSATEVN